MKEEEIIQAANEYVGHAEEAEEDLSTYCNRKSFEAGAKWMQEKMIDKACEWLKENGYKYSDTTDDDCPFFYTNEFIENFEKAMK